jgi:antitoxin component YwqK of YwqJK toxin-antitoxin module
LKNVHGDLGKVICRLLLQQISYNEKNYFPADWRVAIDGCRSTVEPRRHDQDKRSFESGSHLPDHLQREGIIQSQGPILNDKKDGVWREYSNGNGQLTKVIEYKNGVVNGVNLSFGTNGMMASDEFIINGKPEGTRTLMNNMGRVRAIENYKNGDLHGSKKTFYDDGKIQEEGNWKNGQRDGVTKWYTAAGTTSLEHTYANGALQGPVKEYDSKEELPEWVSIKTTKRTGMAGVCRFLTR